MNLIDRLGYTIPDPNRFQRVVQSVASSRPGAAVLSRVLMPLDQFLVRRTGTGKSLPQILAGLPVVVLTTIGRRTGEEREVILTAIPVRGDTLTLIGTNWGRRETPAWVLNLESEPIARLEFGGVACAVVARPVEGSEHEEVMAVAARHYPGYLQYQRRITNRPIRVFSLHPLDS